MKIHLYILFVLAGKFGNAYAELCMASNDLTDDETRELYKDARDYVNNRYDIAETGFEPCADNYKVSFEPYEIKSSTFRSDILTCKILDSRQWDCGDLITHEYVYLGTLSRSIEIKDKTDIDTAIEIIKLIYNVDNKRCHGYFEDLPISSIPTLFYEGNSEYKVYGAACNYGISKKDGQYKLDFIDDKSDYIF